MSVTAILRQADIFYDFNQNQLELIASICYERTFKRNEAVFVEQGHSDELYVVANGEIAIQVDSRLIGSKQEATGPRTLAIARRGQSFGEMALLDEGRRSASARCVNGPARLFVIPRDKLLQLCETYPQLGYRLMFNLAIDLSMKIRNADLRIRDQMFYPRDDNE